MERRDGQRGMIVAERDKKLNYPLILFLLFFIAGMTACASKSSVIKNPVLQNIDAQKAYQMIGDHRGRAGFMIIDVSTPEEFDSGHIPGAVNMNLFSETFQADLDKLDRETTYLVYCRTGMRSAKTLSLMRDRKFLSVYNLFGGMKEWADGEYPVVK
jgi:rhodanese-related sulfurtransferase